jgi:hypothetical protein
LDPTGIFAFPPIPPELLEEGEELFLIPAIVIGTLDEPPSLLDGFTGLAGVAGDPALGYNLATSIGPILGAGGVAHPTELSLNTSGGSLSFLNSIGPDTEGTFTAITATTSVPEPTSLSLLASGILSLTGLSRFRKRA